MSAAKLRAASEAAVAEGKVPDHDLLAAFTAYLKLEETGGDAARLQVPVCSAPLARHMLAADSSCSATHGLDTEQHHTTP